jgi:multidrug transporter EmrE-like cation transporter
MLKWAWILFTVVMSSSGDILCARGMSQGGELTDFGPRGLAHAIRYIVTRRQVILGATCYAIAFFALLGLLRMLQLSAAVPATALGFVVDTLGARFLLKEHVHWKRWLGVMCVTAGVLLAVRSGPVAPERAKVHQEGPPGPVAPPWSPTSTSPATTSAVPSPLMTSARGVKSSRNQDGRQVVTAKAPRKMTT